MCWKRLFCILQTFNLYCFDSDIDLVKRFKQAGYEFCLGCAYVDGQNQCHSIEVCDHQSVSMRL